MATIIFVVQNTPSSFLSMIPTTLEFEMWMKWGGGTCYIFHHSNWNVWEGHGGACCTWRNKSILFWWDTRLESIMQMITCVIHFNSIFVRILWLFPSYFTWKWKKIVHFVFLVLCWVNTSRQEVSLHQCRCNIVWSAIISFYLFGQFLEYILS